MKTRLKLLLSMMLTLFLHEAAGANLIGFDVGAFYSVVGTVNSPTAPDVLEILFDGPVLTDTFVAISSSDPSRLNVAGGGVTVLAGQSSAIVLVTAVDFGNVTLTGYFGPYETTASIGVGSEIPVIPQLNVQPLPSAVRLTWPTNAAGYLLETNSNLRNPAGWGASQTSYSVLNTNFVVTNAVTGVANFYRLRKP